MHALRAVVRAATARIAPNARGQVMVVAHSDFDDENLDLEIGVGLATDVSKRLTLPNCMEMTTRELPAVDRLATVVRSGPPEQSHVAFGSLGGWMEANGYAIAGPCREVFLEMPFEKSEADNVVVEIQFPVRKTS